MTMKNKKTLQHIAAVAVVLLTLCLVFMMPAAADTYETQCKDDTGCDGSGSGHGGNSCDHVAKTGDKYYNSVNAALRAVTNENQIIEIIGDVDNIFTTGPSNTPIYDFELHQLNSTVKSVTFKGVSGTVKIGPSIGYHGNQRTNDYGTVIFDNLTFKDCGITIRGGEDEEEVQFDKLHITNCVFDDSIEYQDAIFIGSPIQYNGVLIQKNTITGYKLGIRLHLTYDSQEAQVTIKENTLNTNGNCVQLTHWVNYTIAGNTLESKGRPLHFMNFDAERGSTFTENIVKFPCIYDDKETKVPTQAIYHVTHHVVIGEGNKFVYTDGDKKDVTAYSSLMKHLYLDKTGARIYVDSVKDEGGYYGGYVSVGLDIPKGEDGKATGVAPAEANPSDLGIKTGYTIAKVHQNLDDGYGYHYIIGKGATSNDAMKLTAGTFVTDPSEFVAEGYVCIEKDGAYVVEAIKSAITATEKVGFDSVKVGYTQPDKQKVTVENTGNVAVTLLEPTAENYIITGFTDGKLTIPYGKTAEFFIQPEAGLPVGNYGIDKVELKIEGSDAVMDTFAVSFLVYQPSSGGSSKPVEEPEEPVEPETPEEPSAGEVTTETAVSNGGEVAFETPAAPETPEAGEPSEGPADKPAEPVVTGVVLPEGTDSKVTFIPVSDKPAPAGKEQQTKKVFEINVPTYEKGKPATVKFTMTVAELAKDGKTAADVALWHQDEETGEWTKLVISYTIIDGVVYFEAITHDFSPFAIVYEDAAVEEPTEEPTEEPASPAPILAVLAGLGAAAVLRRK